MTGKLVWGAGTEWGPSYASLVPGDCSRKTPDLRFRGRREQAAPAAVSSCSITKDGAIDFTFPWRSRSYEFVVNAASPVVVGNQVFISASYRTGGALLNLTPDGKYNVAWTSPEVATHFNTAVVKDGFLYAFDGRNEPDASLVCVELKTGGGMA